jgi:hypothetical protein
LTITAVIKNKYLQTQAIKKGLAKLKNLFRENFYLRDGSINLLHDLLYRLFDSRRIFEGGDDYPTISDFIRILEKTQFRPGSRFSGYHESLTNRFKSLLENLGETLRRSDASRGFFRENRPVKHLDP